MENKNKVHLDTISIASCDNNGGSESSVSFRGFKRRRKRHGKNKQTKGRNVDGYALSSYDQGDSNNLRKTSKSRNVPKIKRETKTREKDNNNTLGDMDTDFVDECMEKKESGAEDYIVQLSTDESEQDEEYDLTDPFVVATTDRRLLDYMEEPDELNFGGKEFQRTLELMDKLAMQRSDIEKLKVTVPNIIKKYKRTIFDRKEHAKSIQTNSLIEDVLHALSRMRVPMESAGLNTEMTISEIKAYWERNQPDREKQIIIDEREQNNTSKREFVRELGELKRKYEIEYNRLNTFCHYTTQLLNEILRGTEDFIFRFNPPISCTADIIEINNILTQHLWTDFCIEKVTKKDLLAYSFDKSSMTTGDTKVSHSTQVSDVAQKHASASNTSIAVFSCQNADGSNSVGDGVTEGRISGTSGDTLESFNKKATPQKTSIADIPHQKSNTPKCVESIEVAPHEIKPSGQLLETSVKTTQSSVVGSSACASDKKATNEQKEDPLGTKWAAKSLVTKTKTPKRRLKTILISESKEKINATGTKEQEETKRKQLISQKAIDVNFVEDSVTKGRTFKTSDDNPKFGNAKEKAPALNMATVSACQDSDSAKRVELAQQNVTSSRELPERYATSTPPSDQGFNSGCSAMPDVGITASVSGQNAGQKSEKATLWTQWAKESHLNKDRKKKRRMKTTPLSVPKQKSNATCTNEQAPKAEIKQLISQNPMSIKSVTDGARLYATDTVTDAPPHQELDSARCVEECVTEGGTSNTLDDTPKSDNVKEKAGSQNMTTIVIPHQDSDDAKSVVDIEVSQQNVASSREVLESSVATTPASEEGCNNGSPGKCDARSTSAREKYVAHKQEEDTLGTVTDGDKTSDDSPKSYNVEEKVETQNIATAATANRDTDSAEYVEDIPVAPQNAASSIDPLVRSLAAAPLLDQNVKNDSHGGSDAGINQCASEERATHKQEVNTQVMQTSKPRRIERLDGVSRRKNKKKKWKFAEKTCKLSSDELLRSQKKTTASVAAKFKGRHEMTHGENESCEALQTSEENIGNCDNSVAHNQMSLREQQDVPCNNNNTKCPLMVRDNTPSLVAEMPSSEAVNNVGEERETASAVESMAHEETPKRAILNAFIGTDNQLAISQDDEIQSVDNIEDKCDSDKSDVLQKSENVIHEETVPECAIVKTSVPVIGDRCDTDNSDLQKISETSVGDTDIEWKTAPRKEKSTEVVQVGNSDISDIANTIGNNDEKDSAACQDQQEVYSDDHMYVTETEGGGGSEDDDASEFTYVSDCSGDTRDVDEDPSIGASGKETYSMSASNDGRGDTIKSREKSGIDHDRSLSDISCHSHTCTLQRLERLEPQTSEIGTQSTYVEQFVMEIWHSLNKHINGGNCDMQNQPLPNYGHLYHPDSLSGPKVYDSKFVETWMEAANCLSGYNDITVYVIGEDDTQSVILIASIREVRAWRAISGDSIDDRLAQIILSIILGNVQRFVSEIGQFVTDNELQALYYPYRRLANDVPYCVEIQRSGHCTLSVGNAVSICEMYPYINNMYLNQQAAQRLWGLSCKDNGRIRRVVYNVQHLFTDRTRFFKQYVVHRLKYLENIVCNGRLCEVLVCHWVPLRESKQGNNVGSAFYVSVRYNSSLHAVQFSDTRLDHIVKPSEDAIDARHVADTLAYFTITKWGRGYLETAHQIQIDCMCSSREHAGEHTWLSDPSCPESHLSISDQLALQCAASVSVDSVLVFMHEGRLRRSLTNIEQLKKFEERTSKSDFCPLPSVLSYVRAVVADAVRNTECGDKGIEGLKRLCNLLKDMGTFPLADTDASIVAESVKDEKQNVYHAYISHLESFCSTFTILEDVRMFFHNNFFSFASPADYKHNDVLAFFGKLRATGNCEQRRVAMEENEIAIYVQCCLKVPYSLHLLEVIADVALSETVIAVLPQLDLFRAMDIREYVLVNDTCPTKTLQSFKSELRKVHVCAFDNMFALGVNMMNGVFAFCIRGAMIEDPTRKTWIEYWTQLLCSYNCPTEMVEWGSIAFQHVDAARLLNIIFQLEHHQCISQEKHALLTALKTTVLKWESWECEWQHRRNIVQSHHGMPISDLLKACNGLIPAFRKPFAFPLTPMEFMEYVFCSYNCEIIADYALSACERLLQVKMCKGATQLSIPYTPLTADCRRSRANLLKTRPHLAGQLCNKWSRKSHEDCEVPLAEWIIVLHHSASTLKQRRDVLAAFHWLHTIADSGPTERDLSLRAFAMPLVPYMIDAISPEFADCIPEVRASDLKKIAEVASKDLDNSLKESPEEDFLLVFLNAHLKDTHQLAHSFPLMGVSYIFRMTRSIYMLPYNVAGLCASNVTQFLRFKAKLQQIFNMSLSCLSDAERLRGEVITVMKNTGIHDADSIEQYSNMLCTHAQYLYFRYLTWRRRETEYIFPAASDSGRSMLQYFREGVLRRVDAFFNQEIARKIPNHSRESNISMLNTCFWTLHYKYISSAKHTLTCGQSFDVVPLSQKTCILLDSTDHTLARADDAALVVSYVMCVNAAVRFDKLRDVACDDWIATLLGKERRLFSMLVEHNPQMLSPNISVAVVNYGMNCVSIMSDDTMGIVKETVETTTEHSKCSFNKLVIKLKGTFGELHRRMRLKMVCDKNNRFYEYCVRTDLKGYLIDMYLTGNRINLSGDSDKEIGHVMMHTMMHANYFVSHIHPAMMNTAFVPSALHTSSCLAPDAMIVSDGAICLKDLCEQPTKFENRVIKEVRTIGVHLYNLFSALPYASERSCSLINELTGVIMGGNFNL